jgi:transcriptional regulator with XRE-family HTH domain
VSTGCPTPQDPCPYRNSCPLARPVHAVTRYVDDPHKLLSQPVYDRELGKCLDLNWSYSTRGAKLYPTTLAWFAREHLTPNEPRYRSEGAVLRPVPQVLVPHPLTGGPIATGRRQLLIERRGEEWVDREEVERATLQPVEDEALKDLVRDVGISQVTRYAQVDKRELVRWLAGRKKLGPRRRAKVLQALHSILNAQAQARTVLRAHPNRTQLAKQLGISPRTLRRYTHGHRPIPPDLLPRILTPAPRSPEADPTGSRHSHRPRTPHPPGDPGGPDPEAEGQEDRRGEGRPTRAPPRGPGTAAGVRRAGRAVNTKEGERPQTPSDVTPVTRHTHPTPRDRGTRRRVATETHPGRGGCGRLEGL